MINNPEVQKLKEECPDFFKKYSPEFLEFIFSENTSSKIAKICLENKIEDEEKIEKIANRAISVLLEQFPKEKLPEVLEKGVKLEPETASKISEQINQLVLSQIPKTQTEKIQKKESKIEKITPAKALFSIVKKKNETPPKKDVY